MKTSDFVICKWGEQYYLGQISLVSCDGSVTIQYLRKKGEVGNLSKFTYCDLDVLSHSFDDKVVVSKVIENEIVDRRGSSVKFPTNIFNEYVMN